MTFLVKCDTCGKVAEAPCTVDGLPLNPPGWGWRLGDGKSLHVCSIECMPSGDRLEGGEELDA